jgi:hypothetical protein
MFLRKIKGPRPEITKPDEHNFKILSLLIAEPIQRKPNTDRTCVMTKIPSVVSVRIWHQPSTC